MEESEMVPLLPGGKIYERLECETNKSYRAFMIYRDLGPTRSQKAVSERVSPTSKVHPSPHIEVWSSKFGWVKRAKVWDAENEKREREALVADIAEMRRRHATQAKALQYKAIERLAVMKPEEMEVGDVLRYFIEAAKLERLSLGEADTKQRVEHSGPDGSPIQIQPVQVLETVIRSRDELKKIKDDTDPTVEILE